MVHTFKAIIKLAMIGINLEIPVIAPPPGELIQPYQTHITEEELDLFAQLVMAEAGNQDLKGKRLVADVVINRVNHDKFPDTIEEVIYDPYQFSCINDGNFDRCKNTITKECYDAIKLEYTSLKIDDDIVYFSSTEQAVNGVDAWKHGKHWFSYY